jgi:hypothetical protein
MQAKVEQNPGASMHIKATGPGFLYVVYITQVSPSEDDTIEQKIAELVSNAKKETVQATITVIVTRIDDKLKALSQAHTINVVDIFTGTIVKGPLIGDQVLTNFMKEKLGLDMANYDGITKGAYTSKMFKDALNVIKDEGSITKPRKARE